jgi:DUF2892 family protein
MVGARVIVFVTAPFVALLSGVALLGRFVPENGTAPATQVAVRPFTALTTTPATASAPQAEQARAACGVDASQRQCRPGLIQRNAHRDSAAIVNWDEACGLTLRTFECLQPTGIRSPARTGCHANEERDMNVDRAVLAFAGIMILVSLLLAWAVSPYWLLLTAFVGLNMVQAAFTGICPAAMAFRKFGLRTGGAFE